MRPISSHLDSTSLVSIGFIIWDKTPKHDKFSMWDKACIPSGQDSSILPAHEIQFIFLAHGASYIIIRLTAYLFATHKI